MDELEGRIDRPIRQTYRLAMLNRWTAREAGNLAAWREGIPVGQDWTLREVTALEFLRWRVDTGRVDQDRSA